VTPGPPETALGVAARIADSAIDLVGRRIALTAMTSVTTAVVARKLGVSEFGVLASALGAYYLALALVDLGFSLVLGRDLARHPETRGQLFRTALRVQGAWAGCIAAALVFLGLRTGIDTTRGGVLVVLAPGILASGLGAGRQVFLVLFRTRRLAAIDLITTAAASGLAVSLAASGAGAVAVAAALSAGTVANALLVIGAAQRLVPVAPPASGDSSRLVRLAVPLGIASLLSSAYFTIDLVLLGWLVAPAALGAYGAATKILTMLVMLPGMALSAALPGFARLEADRGAVGVLAGRVLHWLASFGLPACIGAFVFAGPVVRIAFGGGYEAAVPLVRVLALAAAVGLFANVLGTLLVARGAIRPMLTQNALALILNVAGNLVLVPRFGVIAAAWLTVVTEVFVAACALMAVRARLGAIQGLRCLFGPLTANAAFALVGLALLSRPLLAIPAALVALVVMTHVLHAWPNDLRGMRSRPSGA
jgi:O-antigen/teichoic acid export membrane protein